MRILPAAYAMSKLGNIGSIKSNSSGTDLVEMEQTFTNRSQRVDRNITL